MEAGRKICSDHTADFTVYHHHSFTVYKVGNGTYFNYIFHTRHIKLKKLQNGIFKNSRCIRR